MLVQELKAKLKAPTGNNPFVICPRHVNHKTKQVEINIGGVWKGISNVATVANKYAMPTYMMEVFDWNEYFKTEDGNETVPLFDGHCTGQDIISYCIDRQGCWEGYETSLFANIFSESPKGLFVDIGCQIGWFSIMAARKNWSVVSIDANQECLDMINRGKHGDITTIQTLINTATPSYKLSLDDIHFLKCDIEGHERSAYDLFQKHFENKKVKYGLFEISPCFNDSYPTMVQELIDYGYKVYQMPSKGCPFMVEFSENPLTVLIERCEIKERGAELKDYIASLHQENFFFIRQE